MNQGVTVILPTYKEAENLPLIVPEIADALGDGPLEILVVDDNSPDDGATQAACAALVECGYPVSLTVRLNDRGLASAIFLGIRLAQYDNVIVMDADGQHPPHLLRHMAAALERVDLVAATRYAEGGGVGDWSIGRHAVSMFSNLLAEPLCPQSDKTTGLFGLRRRILDGLHLDAIGWKAGLEIFVKANYATYAEIPFIFEERIAGESKASFKQGMLYLHHLAKLYAYKFEAKKTAKYYLVSGIGAIINFGIATGLIALHAAPYPLAVFLGIAGAMTWNRVLHGKWVFSSGTRQKRERVNLVAQRELA